MTISDKCTAGSALYDKYTITNYQNYETVFARSFIDHIENISGFQSSTSNNFCQLNSTYNLDHIKHRFYVSKFWLIYERYPDTLTTALAKIGGLIAVFKLSILIQYVHKKVYEKRLIKHLTNFRKALQGNTQNPNQTVDNNQPTNNINNTLYPK